MTLNVYVPQKALATYQSANVWKNFWNLQGSNLTGINVTLKNNRERTNEEVYDFGGKQLSQSQHGPNIVKMNDGSTKKLFLVK